MLTEMSVKRAFFAILVGGLVLTLVTVSRAQVDSRRIEEVVKKSVLTAGGHGDHRCVRH